MHIFAFRLPLVRVGFPVFRLSPAGPVLPAESELSFFREMVNRLQSLCYFARAMPLSKEGEKCSQEGQAQDMGRTAWATAIVPGVLFCLKKVQAGVEREGEENFKEDV